MKISQNIPSAIQLLTCIFIFKPPGVVTLHQGVHVMLSVPNHENH